MAAAAAQSKNGERPENCRHFEWVTLGTQLRLAVMKRRSAVPLQVESGSAAVSAAILP